MKQIHLGSAARKFAALAVSAAVLAALAITLPHSLRADRDDDEDDDHDHGHISYPYGVNQTSSRPYSIGLWGDLPYSAEQAAVIPNLIADMNSQDLVFTAQDGDLRQGSGVPSCAAGSTPAPDADIYQRGLRYFNSFKAPAIFTPGDNDWTDCDRQSLNKLSPPQDVNSLWALDHERALFFSTPYTLGKNKFRQEVQSAPLCKGFGSANANRGQGALSDVTKTQTATYTDVPCSENRRWMVGKVMYATINVQGSCDNLCDDYPDATEHAARAAAGIAWMNGTFDAAIAQKCVAVMFITQADPGWDDTDATRAPTRNPNTLVEDDALKATDGYHDFLLALRGRVISFGKPVAYVNGDSHYLRIDKPLLDAAGKRITNFTRVETFGDHQPTLGDVNWLRVDVDPNSREVFTYQPQIVNRDSGLANQ